MYLIIITFTAAIKLTFFPLSDTFVMEADLLKLIREELENSTCKKRGIVSMDLAIKQCFGVSFRALGFKEDFLGAFVTFKGGPEIKVRGLGNNSELYLEVGK
jgi:hypothetical protein